VSLIKLTAPAPPAPIDGSGGEPIDAAVKASSSKKLFIVIDALDRCHPDFALSLLELIKHFFDVPHVHFLLGADMRELLNSISSR
jgi:hypothetical protein